LAALLPHEVAPSNPTATRKATEKRSARIHVRMSSSRSQACATPRLGSCRATVASAEAAAPPRVEVAPPTTLAGEPPVLHDAAMRRVAAATVVPIAFAAGGCTWLEPLGDLDSDADTIQADATGTGAADGGHDAGSADALQARDTRAPGGPTDGGSDTRLDAVGTADAPIKADAPAEADASQHFCASLPVAPVLCEDFDEGTPFDAQFTSTDQGAPGHVGADGAMFKTPPDSLFSTIDQGMAAAYAFLARVFSGTSSRIEYAFDVMLVQAVSGQLVVPAAILVDEGLTTQHQVTLVLGGRNEVEQSFAGPDGGTIFVDTPLGVGPSLGQWSRVDIVVSLAQHTINVTVDGAAALTASPLDSSWPGAGTLSIDLGIAYVSDTSGPWSIRYDDVVVNPQ
jgi:hypothetical protein